MYRLEYSYDEKTWRSVRETRSFSDCSGNGFRRVDVTRHGLREIEREAEFHAARYPHVRIVHPAPAPSGRSAPITPHTGEEK